VVGVGRIITDGWRMSSTRIGGIFCGVVG
jgi:hypothetical protein